jgi:hypothetical protein
MAFMWARSLLVVGLAVLAAAAAGCSFDRQWRALARGPAATQTQTDPLAGRWDGKWVSDRNGHSGRLRAIVTPADATSYRAEFSALFLGIMRFDHGANLTAAAAREPDGAMSFEGKEDLGALAGGVYQYKGTADGQSFIATYECKGDHGRFEMSRPVK